METLIETYRDKITGKKCEIHRIDDKCYELYFTNPQKIAHTKLNKKFSWWPISTIQQARKQADILMHYEGIQ